MSPAGTFFLTWQVSKIAKIEFSQNWSLAWPKWPGGIRDHFPWRVWSHGAKHSLNQNCLGCLRPFEHLKLPDPQKWTLEVYNYIKYKPAMLVAKSTFAYILDLSAILFSWSNSNYSSVSSWHLCSSMTGVKNHQNWIFSELKFGLTKMTGRYQGSFSLTGLISWCEALSESKLLGVPPAVRTPKITWPSKLDFGVL